MTPRGLLQLLAAYFCLLAVLSVVIIHALKLDLSRKPGAKTIVSVWQRGHRVARAVTTNDPAGVLASEAKPGSVRVFERVVDEGPLLHTSPLLLGASLVAGRDGIFASYQGQERQLTPDDLLSHQVYRHKWKLGGFKLNLGVDPHAVLDLLSEEFDVPADELRAGASFRRFVVHRSRADQRGEQIAHVTPEQVGPKTLRRSVLQAAHYLARHLRRDGAFDYEINATNHHFSSGYSWPRHAGATLFLAEAARWTGDRHSERAAVRAAARLRDGTTLRCGIRSCIGQGDRVDLGSSALALLAYAEIVRAGLDDSFREPIRELSEFLRSQQRPDGEFMHIYDRRAQRPLDIQLRYYSGEATLALSRAHRITRNGADLQAASRALAYLTDHSRRYFGSRYLYLPEHWTCQALEDIWRRAPNQTALRFCLDWQAFNRSTQYDASTELGSYDGGYLGIPLMPPRLCKAGSRSEAGVATLVTAIYAGVDQSEVDKLENQLRRSFAFLLRHQFDPGPTHLMANPAAMRGGFSGSPIDYKVRIDLPQHIGSAMIRYARLLEQRQQGRIEPPP